MSTNDKKSRFITEPEAIRLLSEYGVPFPKNILAGSKPEAVAAAKRIGYPVVLKIVSPDIVHKSEAGGVVTGLANQAAVAAGFDDMTARVRSRAPGAKIEGVLVCHQADEGIELIVGTVMDKTLGPTVMCGLGGIFAEVLKDVCFRLAPLQMIDAQEMLEELQGYPVLTGLRGRSAIDMEALCGLLLNLSRLVVERGDILELDLNPVRVYAEGLLALDARIMVDAGIVGWPGRPES